MDWNRNCRTPHDVCVLNFSFYPCYALVLVENPENNATVPAGGTKTVPSHPLA